MQSENYMEGKKKGILLKNQTTVLASAWGVQTILFSKDQHLELSKIGYLCAALKPISILKLHEHSGHCTSSCTIEKGLLKKFFQVFILKLYSDMQHGTDHLLNKG